MFKTKRKNETTICYPDPMGLTDYKAFCNLTERNGGMPFFCGTPDTLSCEDLYYIKHSIKQPHPALDDVDRVLLSRYVHGGSWDTVLTGKYSIGTTSANSAEFCGNRPWMYIKDLL